MVGSRERVDALRSRMTGEGVDAFLAVAVPNVRYLTGFDGVFDTEEAFAAVVTADEVRLYTDSRYAEAATAAASGGPWTIHVSAEDPFAVVAAELTSMAKVTRLAVEDSLCLRRFESMRERFGGETISTDRWVEGLRVAKDAEEIDRISRAQVLVDRAFEHLLGFVSVGMTERDVALELEFFMRREGSEGVAFPPIVASGPNSSLPHAGVTDRVIEDGDLLKLDFGARIGGYCSDMTRTVVMGRASERQRGIYDAVLEANLAGIAAVREGVRGVDVDAVARGVLEEHGLAELFGHGLGHGVGLEVHEAPSLGRRGSDELPAGAVVTIEPGVYVPGFGGVRIEDLVVVEPGGARVLTASTKDLIEL